MNLTFTEAACRALWEAARWSSGAAFAEIEAPALLLALLGEAECRAAMILNRHQIDEASVRRQWSGLRPSSGREPESEALIPPLSPEVADSLAVAAECLADLPQPFDFATEHLLLGLVAGENQVGRWLAQQGLQAESLEAEILSVYGLSAGPLPLDDPLPIELPEEPTDAMPTPIATEPVPAGYFAENTTPAIPLLRLIDAAANRAREGLRTIEDYVRFVLDDGHLTGRLKALRHGLVEALSAVPLEHRLAGRDTRADVGTAIATASEKNRQDTFDVVTANFTRLQEALRSLEEYSKISSAEAAAKIESLRYQSYVLQKALAATRSGLDRLGGARLCVLVDGRCSVDEFEKLVGALVAAGAGMIQLRDKTLGDRELLDRARRLRRLTRSGRTLFIVNDRADLAALAEADGVHVGQDDVSVKDARTIVGPRAIVGVSTHSIEQARQAVLDGACYIGIGPTFASGTKRFDTFPGLDYLGQVAAEIRLPAFAIGGIDAGNVAQVLRAGATRVAVSGAVLHAADPAAAMEALLAKVGAGP